MRLSLPPASCVKGEVSAKILQRGGVGMQQCDRIMRVDGDDGIASDLIGMG
jgi:hypothetical protein